MIFRRVNEHMLRCMIKEEEIIEMGFDLEDICRNQERATEFMKLVLEKGNEEGFEMSENITAVQAAFLPDHQIVLSFTEHHVEEMVDRTIQSLLKAFGLGVLNGMNQDKNSSESGSAEEDLLKECIEEAAASNEVSGAETIEAASEEEEKAEHPVIPLAYIVEFPDLDTVEQFCKACPSVPGTLYKQKERYFLVAQLTDAEDSVKKTFFMLAGEFAQGLKKESLQSGFLAEHGDVLIKENPMEVLKLL
ncbi:adaptor protein MecA [[Clostridium] polysaccharolyticum]|uniref:Negative regulator of genetic competence, sporulation and motility n=1 Tax=[Clostridium] polysaccharolyticum TaxID=29364 RepID=A0A1I0CJ71_9FIRM|nr:adaptor protein MecA [[Clostridium] polysaccharolyticum]SET19653.1 Negative regulator of genetic competence, sporulation and motility [[Clostridium] polysaccharolyticum]